MIEINTPERVGMSASALKEIDTAMHAFVDQSKFAGIATMVANAAAYRSLNLLNRNFMVSGPGQVWVSDLTYSVHSPGLVIPDGHH